MIRALAFSVVLAAPAAAQVESRLDFPAGSDTGAAQGAVVGDAYVDHLLGARAGQTMAVALAVEETDGSGTAYFNILPPGSDGVAIFNSSMVADNFGEVTLPADGDYRVRV